MSDSIHSRLMVLMFTDLVGSVDLKTRLGNAAYVGMIARHDELFKSVVRTVPGAEVLKDTGDGFLARFATASDGVSTALRFQWHLHTEPWKHEPLKVRVGLHIGEVAELQGTDIQPKLVGLAADFAARVMGLAEPGQILATRTVFDDARQYLRDHPAVSENIEPPELKWMAHGPYMLKGGDEPVDVFEVGAVGVAPLYAPPDSEKALRVVEPGAEDLLGWRPATGAEIPGRDGWILDRRRSEGSGENWIASHRRTNARHVFKFCYDANRLPVFKQETSLVRLLRATLGDRHDIAQLHEVRLDQPPYFLESQYTKEGDLAEWAATCGGIGSVPLVHRIDVVARTAAAVAEAHSVGILHKDIRPANILITESKNGPRPCLADFGIGALTDPLLDAKDVSETRDDGTQSRRTGAQLYAPPETHAGHAFTPRGDIYALGVLLYQMAIGDLGQAVRRNWQREVENKVLRRHIEACLEVDPNRRLGDAGELAEWLHEFDPRPPRAARETALETTARERLQVLPFVKLKCGRSSGQEGRVIKLVGRNFTFGRGDKCAVTATSDEVSRTHMRLRLARSGWFVQDLKSSNGTYLNGERIGSAVLRVGDRLSLGKKGATYKVVGLQEEPGPSAPPRP